MNWQLWAAVASGVITSVCYVPYIRDTIKGTTRPNRVTWLIWAILGWITFFSQSQSGATYSLVFIIFNSIGPTIIFLLSLRRGEGGYEFLDVLSLIGAATGLIAWWLTSRPELALYLSLSVDLFGVFPTLKKSYVDPGSETTSLYALGVLGAALAAFSVGHLSFVLLLYPAYLFVADGAVTLMLLLSPNRHKPATT